MKFKDIAANLTSQPSDEDVTRFAKQLSEQNSGKLSALLVDWIPSVAPAVDAWVINPYWGEMVEQIKADLRKKMQTLKERLNRECEGSSVDGEVMEMGEARAELGLRARHSDVTIVARPTEAGWDSSQTVLEGVLFGSGRPVIVVPPNWKASTIGRKILVCWKPTREAARALADAEDFLTTAETVGVATVDAKPSIDGYGDQPGADITAHLARRDISAELFDLASAGRTEARAVLDQAVATGADLIVMGAYGRSRLSEFIFGGMTREMLRTSTVPILLSH